MAGKTLFPTEGSEGGIKKGSPFAVNAFTKVEQDTPPFINTGRMAELSDAEQSIIAPGILGSAHSFIMGEGTTDSANGDRALLIGYHLQQNSDGTAHQADDQVMIGNRIAVPLDSPNSQGVVAVGSLITFNEASGHNSFGGTVAIGAGVTVNASSTSDGLNAVAIGFAVTVTGSKGVAIGDGTTTTNDEGIAIGLNAFANTQGVGIGSGASADAQDVAIGHLAKGAGNAVAIGAFSTTFGHAYNIAIGSGADASGGDNQLIIAAGPEIGDGPIAIDNLLCIGRLAPYGYTSFVWGNGINTDTGAVNYLMRTTDIFGGAGANLPGMGWTFQAGHGTGNWANTVENLGFDFQVGFVGGSGTAVQAYTSVLAMRQSDLNVAWWGGLTAPFSGGVGVMFLKNATTPPTVAALAGGGILSVQGGNLHFLNSGGVDTALTPGGGGGTIDGTVSAGFVTVGVGADTVGDSVLTYTTTTLGPTTDNVMAIGDASHCFANVFAATLTGRSGSVNLTINQPGASGQVNIGSNGTGVLSVSANGLAVLPLADGTIILGDSTALRWKSVAMKGLASLSIDSSTAAAASGVLTLTNGPTGKSGNPTKFLTVKVDGTNVVIPCW